MHRLLKWLRRQRRDREQAQSLTEYAIMLLLVGIAVVLVLVLLQASIENAFRRFVDRAPVAPPNIGPIGGQFTPRPPTDT
ncbi:MAG: hypothetical protein KDE09_01855, partial [Anaerolineales bacterium]|nr:hypothetical protein [Anaerolineales bacterium]